MTDGRPADDLHADCSRCFGLCCVALPFSASGPATGSTGFAIDKAAGAPCPNLGADFRCGIHTRLRGAGFAGCAVFDCFGAGQRVSQVTFGGRSWREPGVDARRMFDAFGVMRALHEILWYLTEAVTLPAARPVRGELREALDRTRRLTRSGADDLLALDVAAHRAAVGALLRRTSELVRARVDRPARNRAGAAGVDRAGADLAGADLRGARLRGASLRGAYLMAADLTGADLRTADLLGADLRDARLAGADLTGALFLTQPQVEAARGDDRTVLPGRLTRPAHW